MNQPAAAQVNLPGSLYRRPGSANFWYALRVPADLQNLPQYREPNGKPKVYAFRRSLGTPDHAEAQRLALQELQRWQERWAIERRQAKPLTVTELAPEMVQQLGDYIRFCVFNADDYHRDSPYGALRLALVQKLAAGDITAEEFRERLEEAATAPADGLDELAVEGLAAWNKGRSHKAGVALAARRVSAIRADAEAAAEWLGLSYDWDQEAALPVLRELLKVKRKALAEVAQRDSGEVAETPQEPRPTSAEAPKAERRAAAESTTVAEPPPAKKRRTGPIDILTAPPESVHLRDVFEDWAKHGKPGRKGFPVKTVAKYERALKLYEAHTTNPSMATVSRADGVAFMRALSQAKNDKGEPLTGATIRDTIINAGTLLNHYSGASGRLAHGLWSRITLKIDTGPGMERDEWEPEELVKLFDMPVWQRYELPTGKNGGLDAAYWVPLMGLYTGARVTELAQLRVDDFTEQDGMWFLSINEDGDEAQSIKAAGSRRVIPLPAGLLELGLLDYRRDIMAMGQQWLFPGVTKASQNNAGGGVSKWFSDLKISAGFRPAVVFHSFRGSLNTALLRASVPLELRCKYIGQKPEGGVNVDHYAKLKPRDLLPVAAAVAFPFLKLPRVYQRPAWHPGWKEGRGAEGAKRASARTTRSPRQPRTVAV